jgi:hypothetical protein
MKQIQPCLNFEGKTCVLVMNQILQFFYQKVGKAVAKNLLILFL